MLGLTYTTNEVNNNKNNNTTEVNNYNTTEVNNNNTTEVNNNNTTGVNNNNTTEVDNNNTTDVNILVCHLEWFVIEYQSDTGRKWLFDTFTGQTSASHG